MKDPPLGSIITHLERERTSELIDACSDTIKSRAVLTPLLDHILTPLDPVRTPLDPVLAHLDPVLTHLDPVLRTPLDPAVLTPLDPVLRTPLDPVLTPVLTPLDPVRQAKRLPIRILKMLSAHTGHHLLHPEYLQPLTSAPVSIELDAKKSPLALLAQTCSQIGKPDPPSSSSSSSKLSSVSSSGSGDKESGSGRSSSSSSGLKHGGDHRAPVDDKSSSFKPYKQVGGGGECRSRDGGVSSSSSSSSTNGDKAGFRVHNGNNSSSSSSTANGSSTNQSSFAPHAISPNSRTGSATPPGGHAPQPHRQSQSPSGGGRRTPHSQTLNGEGPGAQHEHGSPSSTSGGGNNNNSGGHLKKEEIHKAGLDSPQHANSSHVRASANSSNGSSDSGVSTHEGGGGKGDPQPALAGHHVAPISPYKTSQSLFPLSAASAMGYHGSVVGAYAGYPSPHQFMSGLDKSGLGMGKHPSASSPPSFMQGLCRDPYCLSYPSSAAPHLGGSNCNSCLHHDPSAGLKSAGFPSLVYPSHHAALHHHSLHPGSLSSSVASSLAHHPLYAAYGFMQLPPNSDPQPHACNWVSAGGPCDKRFANSDELLSHLRTHTALSGGGIMDAGKLLSGGGGGCPVSSAGGVSPCHGMHLPPHQSGAASLPSTFSLRAPPGLGLARYHPYSKVHLPPGGPASIPLHSLPAAAPYYPHYALYSQRLGSASALGYQ